MQIKDSIVANNVSCCCFKIPVAGTITRIIRSLMSACSKSMTEIVRIHSYCQNNSIQSFLHYLLEVSDQNLTLLLMSNKFEPTNYLIDIRR